MRKSTISTILVLFCTLLVAHQIPEALAQPTEVPCNISGHPYVYVQLQQNGAAPGPLGASGGACAIEPTSLPTKFGAYLTPGTSTNALRIESIGDIYPSCGSTTRGLLYDISKPAEGTIFLTDTSGPLFNATLTKQGGSLGFNHLAIYTLLNFTNAIADLRGDAIIGNVDGTDLLFDSPLEGCTSGGRNYVVLRNPIPNNNPLFPIPPGPGFWQDCQTSPSFKQIDAIYIPVNADWSLDFRCDTTYFGPVLRDNNHAVPAFSGYGLLFFCLGIFGLGIWAMRKTRFGNTLAGL